jgi:hypothetical protein
MQATPRESQRCSLALATAAEQFLSSQQLATLLQELEDSTSRWVLLPSVHNVLAAFVVECCRRVSLACAAIPRLVDLSRKRLALDVLSETEQKRVGQLSHFFHPLANNPAAAGAILGPFMWFSPECCSGRYRLDLSEPYQRLLAKTLQG